jgi:hypothetical protein
MARARRRPFHEMDHDHKLLREEVAQANRSPKWRHCEIDVGVVKVEARTGINLG